MSRSTYAPGTAVKTRNMRTYWNANPGALALTALALNLAVSYHSRAAVFTYTESLGEERAYHSATLLPNGKVLVVGGWGFDPLASAELYDCSNGVWSATGALVTTSRLHHKATLLPNGNVLVAGGWDGWNTLATAELYDPATEVWTQTDPMSIGRYEHTLTLLTNGLVLVAGGVPTALGTTNSGLASAELYNPTTGTWTTTGSMTTNRWRHQATLLFNGKVLVAGGVAGALIGGARLSSAEIYDPESGTWTPTGDMTTNRAGFTATLLLNGQVLAAGGRSPQMLSTAELYDPAAGTWRATGALNGPRAFHRATLLPDGQVLVAGGYASPDGYSLNTAELYDPATGRWSNTGPMNQEREDFTATLLADGKVLIAAGQYYLPPPDDYFITLSSAELYDSARGPISLVDSIKQPGGAFQFAFTGAPLGTNTVLTATDPAAPLAHWTSLGIAPEFAPGLYLFTDPQPAGDLQRFYRVLSP